MWCAAANLYCCELVGCLCEVLMASGVLMACDGVQAAAEFAGNGWDVAALRAGLRVGVPASQQQSDGLRG